MSKTEKFGDNLRLLLSVITSFSQDGCLIFLVFLTKCKIIIIFHKFRPKKAFTSSYEAAEPYFRLVSQVIKSFCDFPKTWKKFQKLTQVRRCHDLLWHKHSSLYWIQPRWVNFELLTQFKQDLRDETVRKTWQWNRRKNYLFHEKFLISRTRRNFAFLKTWPCRELNLEGGHVLRFLI